MALGRINGMGVGFVFQSTNHAMPAIMNTLFIERPVLRAMLAHAEACAEECCGLFWGYDEGARRRVTKSLAVRNSTAADTAITFAISARDYLHAEHQAAMDDLALLGVYHSHPNRPPVPSATDLAAALPYFSYVIIAVMNSRADGLRSWRLDPELHFKEEGIDIVETTD